MKVNKLWDLVDILVESSEKEMKQNLDIEPFTSFILQDLIPYLSEDLDDNLILSNADNLAIRMDSSIAFAIGTYFTNMGYALEEIEKVTNQPPKEKYDHINKIGYKQDKETYNRFKQLLQYEKENKING
jgi:hypothetical protein